MRPTAFICSLIAALLLPVGPALADGDWAWPVHGQVLTQFRNGDDPYAAGQHRGVDIAAPVGTPVVAAAPGTVVYAGVVGSSGLVVSERSADGRFELSYLHLSATSVRRGQAVGRGDAIGEVGVTGTRAVDAAHLHFGVREAGDKHAYLDPLPFLAPPPAEAPEPRAVPVPVQEPVVAPPLPAAPAATVEAHPPAPAPGHFAPHPVRLPHAHPLAQVLRAFTPSATPRHASMAPHARAHSAHAPSRKPVHSPLHGPAAVASAHRAAPAPTRAAAHTSHHGGIDRGWLAACGGLVVAAALLATPRGGERPRPSARATFGALIRAASRP